MSSDWFIPDNDLDRRSLSISTLTVISESDSPKRIINARSRLGSDRSQLVGPRLSNSLTSFYIMEYKGIGVGAGLSRLSTSQGHITDCKLDTVVHGGIGVVSSFGLVLFGPNDLSPAVFRCQATDSIPPQVSRKESLTILTPSLPVGCLPY